MRGNTTPPQALRSLAVTVTTTNVQFSFNHRPSVGFAYFGGLYVDLAQAIPEGTTATLPIVFTSEGGNPTPVVGINGVPITVAEITGTGVYHLFYNERANYLQLIAPYAPAAAAAADATA